MEIYFDKNGNVLPLGRPYINQEETNRVWAIYNPHDGPFYGLYTKNQHNNFCTKDYFWPKNTLRKPDYFINNLPPPIPNYRKLV
jgi:hypothetical protein